MDRSVIIRSISYSIEAGRRCRRVALRLYANRAAWVSGVAMIGWLAEMACFISVWLIWGMSDGNRLREGGCKVSEFSKLVVFGVVGEGAGLPFFYAVFARLAPCSFRSEDVVA